jgi:hypothetical protein
MKLPMGFPGQKAHWISFALDSKETETKTKAILNHYTQMLVMGRFLLSFARNNELFVVAL